MTSPPQDRAPSWSGNPFGPKTSRSSLRLAQASLGEGGESHGVREITGHSGWVAKLYKAPLPAADTERLGRLIALPNILADDERALLDRSMAWPVSRITDPDGTVGVIMARIPACCYVRFAYGKDGRTGPRELQLDHLVMADAKFATLGLDAPLAARREQLAARFLALGALLERHDVVYGDWSYRNALWSRQTGEVFLIDLDSCGIGSRPWIRSHHWEDPLFPSGTLLTTGSDRYRMAVLALRVLTGTRGDPQQALRQFESQWAASGGKGRGNAELVALLSRALTTSCVNQRPTVAALLSALEAGHTLTGTADGPSGGAGGAQDSPSAGAGGANVVGWRTVPPPVTAGRPTPAGVGPGPAGPGRAGRRRAGPVRPTSAAKGQPAPRPHVKTPASPPPARQEMKQFTAGVVSWTILICISVAVIALFH